MAKITTTITSKPDKTGHYDVDVKINIDNHVFSRTANTKQDKNGKVYVLNKLSKKVDNNNMIKLGVDHLFIDSLFTEAFNYANKQIFFVKCLRPKDVVNGKEFNQGQIQSVGDD